MREVLSTTGKAVGWGILATLALLVAGTRIGTALGVAVFVAASIAFADWNWALAERELRRTDGEVQGWVGPTVVTATLLSSVAAALALLSGAGFGKEMLKNLLILWFVLFGVVMLGRPRPKPAGVRNASLREERPEPTEAGV